MALSSTLTEYTKKSFFEMMKDVATSIPGHILSFDPVTQLAQIQVGIARKDVNGKEFTPSPIIEVPVYFYGGDAFTVECEINPNDGGIVLFSQRCIDGWVTTGGVANNPIMRFHDRDDAMFLPGLRSQPKVISDFANDGIRLRNKEGNQYVWLKNDGSIQVATVGGNFTISAGGAFEGNFSSFNVNSGSFTHNGTNVGDDHVHSGVSTGGSNTQGPQ